MEKQFIENDLKNFDSLINSTKNQLVEMAIADDKIPVGYTCSYIPQELLSIGNLFPLRLLVPEIESTENAELYLPSTLCSYCKSLLEFAMTEEYPHQIRGWVFTSSCQHMARLYDNLRHINKEIFTFMVDLPQRTDEDAVNRYADELGELARFLSDRFEVEYSNQAIMQSIHEYNQFRAVIDSIDDLRKQKIPLISGREFYKIMIASVSSPQAYFSGALKKTLEQLKKRQGIHSYRAKILLTGCLTGDMRLIDLIEKTGGLIVADQLCTGSKSGPGSICETGDPIHSIASHYLNKTTCPRMMGKFDDRLKALVKSFEDYRADGVIIETIKFCDMWGIEARQIAVELKKRNIPVLKIDREYRLTAEGQLKTRIQAFLESMNK